jgi:hypothetical protein
MLQKLIQAGAIIALLTGTAAAQLPMGLHLGGDKPPPTAEEIEKQKAIDKAYNSATAKIPEKKTDDPWATVRSAPNSPAASKDKQASKNKQQ